MRTSSLLISTLLLALTTACGRDEPQAAGAVQRSVVVETPLSDSELSAHGEEILYRFRSVPNVVLLGDPSPDSGVPITSSTRVATILNEHRKSQMLQSLPTPRLSLLAEASSQGPVHAEARFRDAFSLMDTNDLAPVSVALLDSGVVPVTKPIQSILWKATNFTTETDPCVWQNHGTAIASLLAGVTFEPDRSHPCASLVTDAPAGQPTPALAPNARLHSVKISFDSDALSTLRADIGAFQLAIALDEAVSSGARLVNLSFSYSQEDPPEDVRAIEALVMGKAAEKGVMFVVAAGNGGHALEGRESYPAKYGLDNVVVVGAHDETLHHSNSSNYGEPVDLTAQGVALPANTRSGQVMLFSGTSFSAPVVLAALSLYEGRFPQRDHRRILRDLFVSANPSYASPQHSMDLASPNPPRPSRFGRLDVASFMEWGTRAD